MLISYLLIKGTGLAHIILPAGWKRRQTGPMALSPLLDSDFPPSRHATRVHEEHQIVGWVCQRETQSIIKAAPLFDLDR